MSKKIQLIIGSTREGRVAPSIADWIQQLAGAHEEIELEVVDLKEVNLPFFDEATPPAYKSSTKKHAVAWSERIAAADGYIFLTAEYNRGMPSSLKNAIDYLVKEWEGKPAVIVSYGFIDGGMSASRHLRDVLDWLKVHTVDPTVGIHLKQEMMGEDGKPKDAEKDFAEYEEPLREALTKLAGAEELTAAKSA